MSDNYDMSSGFAWVENPERIGERLFTFDGERIFNLFRDYPYELTKAQKQIFDNANPYWADFFKDRTGGK
ncbi:hypothetical protein LJC63_02190 [Ruminococcaceae bacterium OttesenSCG-928-L11]|nr:hypothetical protein [Ruminococcaceae bacterium OttesenSCG-928-L11]